ncbi:MAG TPA: metallophosphoesterase [Blastocatellia bacterium]|nr:metallophosphoesterase [Blastocatellia bacterium]
MKNIVSKFILFFAATFLFVVSATASFAQDTTAKSAITFAVIGDSGSGDEAQRAVANQMVKQRQKTPFEFVLMLGDNIYEKGEKEKIGTHFEEPYKELLAAGVKFYASLGNHDIIKGTEFQTNYKNFNMGGRRYYNVAQGNGLLEFFALDSNVMDDKQLGWLDESLKASKARWKITFSHHSIYSSARMHPAYTKLRAQLEPLYIKYGVSAVFAGHSHCYERTQPQKGIQYFTEGASGEIKKKTLDRKSPLMAFGEDSVNSFLIVQVTETEMKVEAIAADGKLIDSHTIKR